MAEILKIDGNKVKIGDGDKVVTVDLKDLNYDNPSEGDKVKIYKDGKNYIVSKVSSTASMDGIFGISANGDRKVNKHLFVWVGTFLLGGFGVDRFLRGQIAAGICKLLFSWLTLGIWPLVDFIVALSKAYGGAFSNVEEITFDSMGNYAE